LFNIVASKRCFKNKSIYASFSKRPLKTHWKIDFHDDGSLVFPYLFKGKNIKPFSSGHFHRRVIFYEDKVFVGIKEVIDSNYKGPLYDIEVEDEHNFATTSCIVHNSIDYRNPMPTDLPSWLPHDDNGYFLNFGRGDVYTSIKEPWLRLPGAGLAELNPELKGISPENYSPFWKHKVLGDLAPWSDEFRHADALMSQMEADRRLTASEILEVAATRKQVSQMKKKNEFDHYLYDQSQLTKVRVNITGEAGTGAYFTDTFGGAPIVLAGIETNEASLARVAMQRDSTLSASAAMQKAKTNKMALVDYLRDHVYPGAEIDVLVHSDYLNLMQRRHGQPVIPAAVLDKGGRSVNAELIRRGLAEASGDRDAISNIAGSDIATSAFGGFWENLMHGMETPLETLTPLAPTAKFIHQRTPLEDYLRTRVYSREVAMWNNPIQHFLAPGLSTAYTWAGWDGIPRSVKQRWMVQEYFDRLEYALAAPTEWY
jgi:hypothetical protein